jgi:hypothetical protein
VLLCCASVPRCCVVKCLNFNLLVPDRGMGSISKVSAASQLDFACSIRTDSAGSGMGVVTKHDWRLTPFAFVSFCRTMCPSC